MSKALHILHLAAWYPSRVLATNGNFIERHVKAIAKRNKSTLIHMISEPGRKESEVTKLEEGNLTSFIVYLPEMKKSWLSPFQKYDRYKKQLFSILEKIDPVDLVHLHVLNPYSRIALDLLRQKKLPFVVSEHWTGYHNGAFSRMAWSYKNIFKSVGRNASGFTAVSEHLAKSIADLKLANNVVKIGNVVDTELFVGSPKNKPQEILHVSSLNDEHKNISGIIRVVKELSKSHSGFVFKIVGDGEIEPWFKMRDELNIPKDILKIEGEKSIEEIADLMKKASLFVLFSNYENQPCVILEALAAETPVISTDVGGIPEIFEDFPEHLIQAKDEAALLEKLKQFLDHPSTFNRQELFKKIRSENNQNAISKQFDEFYRSVLKA